MPHLKTLFSLWHGTRLSLSFHKIGCGSAMPHLKTSFSLWHGTRLSLSLHKIGCGSAVPHLKTSFSLWHGARLSLSLHPNDVERGRVAYLPERKLTLAQTGRFLFSYGYLDYISCQIHNTFRMKNRIFLSVAASAILMFSSCGEKVYYAAQFGIELIPCIQTLAHLRTIYRWQEYSSQTLNKILAENQYILSVERFDEE